MPSRRSKDGLLARVNFPLYTVQMLTSRHILVGGGGGSSKTGVANGFEIFELSHDGVHFVAEEVTRHETGPSVVMNCASYSNGKKTWLVAGQESYCQLYNVSTNIVTSENGELIKGPPASARATTSEHGLRHRRNSEKVDEAQSLQEEQKIETEKKTAKRLIEFSVKERTKHFADNNSNIENRKLQLILKPDVSVKTAFGSGEPLQRVVRVSPNGNIMATGSTDGEVTLWKFPNLAMMCNINVHENEIDDIDFSPDSKLLVSIAKDGKAFLWKVEKNVKDKELTWTPPNGVKYMYKRCRFRKDSAEDKARIHLFMLSNAVTAKNPSYLQLWDAHTGSIVKSASYDETLSALAVSDNGQFVAVGTMFSGSVDIFIAFSLRKAFHVPGAHSMFVTGLEFLPTDNLPIISNTETAVVSISVDNKICIHSIPFRHTMPFWFVIILIALCVCGAFILCSYLGI